MLARHKDPIVAVATAAGRGAVGIVRVSGHGLDALARALLGRVPAARQASFMPFRAADGSSIDRGLAIHFPAPQSYTGEDVLELQAHGGAVLLQLLVARCLEAAAEIDPTSGAPRLARLRLAEPGEFSERAFLNGKMDLAQAEAVADLIDAGTEAAARGAARSLDGALSREVEALRGPLIELRMLVEATLDFPEEEIDFLRRADALGRLDRLAAQLNTLRARARQGALLREGLRVVIAGQPNVGKSSLLNALAGAELAIVTPIAGTTRDKLRETIQIEGVPLHVVDTAGLRDAAHASDEVERIGMARSWQAIGEADAVLLLHDLTRIDDAAYQAQDREIEARLPAGVPVLHVFNKRDAASSTVLAQLAARADAIGLSARSGEGLDALRQRLLALAGWQAVPEGVFIARARHLRALQAGQVHLQAARAHAARGDAALELLAEELRLAHDALGAITGAISSDDLLGEIFGHFCIGK